MKPDERAFLTWLQNSPDARPRDYIQSEGCPMHHKRAWRILEKWSAKDWYDYGVCLDLGWLTPEGRTK